MIEKPFLLQYTIDRWRNCGEPKMALVFAKDLQEAKYKLKNKFEYAYDDIYGKGIASPENVVCLNIN